MNETLLIPYPNHRAIKYFCCLPKQQQNLALFFVANRLLKKKKEEIYARDLFKNFNFFIRFGRRNHNNKRAFRAFRSASIKPLKLSLNFSFIYISALRDFSHHQEKVSIWQGNKKFIHTSVKEKVHQHKDVSQ